MRTTVEIFKTNVCCNERAQKVLEDLSALFPAYAMNFDLEDEDRILRVEAEGLIDPAELIHILERKNDLTVSLLQ